ncbi:hypothetical protein E4U19_005350 [Claviceps sp. Clav32 group G5]|nr:hypothetical protein E4U40_005066 [Claviceps sp. LM458 group G5]KAG6034903.1 hypothetical protein E4U19_005350 [Claviceps sp. Clav32 group G5]KAG6043612.1 hypothetical protein E4U39_004339 [Claviceps sp. Clav50 group G5]
MAPPIRPSSPESSAAFIARTEGNDVHLVDLHLDVDSMAGTQGIAILSLLQVAITSESSPDAR